MRVISQRLTFYSIIVNQPFRAPQSDGYPKSIARLATCYLAFICRAYSKPVDNFPVLLTDQQAEAVANLHLAIAEQKHLLTPIHKLAYSLLTTARPETAQDEMICPLRRFLILVFLKEDGTYLPVHLVPPYISKLQYFLRSVGVVEAYDKSTMYETGVIG